MGYTDQRLPEINSCSGPQETRYKKIVALPCLQHFESSGRISDSTGNKNRVTACSTRAVDRAAFDDVARNLDADDDIVPPGRVTTDKRKPVLSRGDMQTLCEPADPVFVSFGHCQGQHHPARPSAHRGDVGQVDCHGAITEVGCCNVDREMHGLDQGINHANEFATGVRLQYGAVIAYTGDDTGRFVRSDEIALNQFKFIHGFR